MSRFNVREFLLPLKAVAKFEPGLNLATASFISFLFSNGVGNSWRVLLDRFNDLAKLRPYFDSKQILEFGTGSSTAYFLNHAKFNCSLRSYEQDLNFLPKYVFSSSRATAVISEVSIERYGLYEGSRFKDSTKDIATAEFIYVDGPVSPLDSKRGMAGPNLDLLIASNLDTKVIAVDRRHLTVILLLEKLSKSHFFIPTERFLKDLNLLGQGSEMLAVFENDTRPILTLERTCVFIPRK
jgi:hypothetical protein